MPLIPSLPLQRSYKQLNGGYLFRRLWLLTVAVLWFAPPALANPLAAYCLSKIGPKRPPTATRSGYEEPARVAFQVKGEPFQVVASRDRLLLTRGDDPTPLAEVEAQQGEFRHIYNLVLGRDGWLWINGIEVDYMAPLNLQQLPPTLGSPVALPELTIEPCASLWRFLWYYMNGCSRPEGRYSPTLNRAFVTGHRITLLGWPSLVSFEIVAGEAKRLPAKFYDARFVADVPQLNGSLLRGHAGEALFYDGVLMTPLLTDFPDRPTDDTAAEWIVVTVSSGRAFLRNPRLLGRQPFLMELKAGPILTPISLPDEPDNSWLDLLVFPDDPRLWGVSRHSIMVQINNSWETVVTVPAPSFISGPTSIGQALDAAIVFTVRKGIEMSSDYFLVRASPGTPCDAPLNPARPIVLDSE